MALGAKRELRSRMNLLPWLRPLTAPVEVQFDAQSEQRDGGLQVEALDIWAQSSFAYPVI
jgi:hypothetical protein